jgi:hypothetical protein
LNQAAASNDGINQTGEQCRQAQYNVKLGRGFHQESESGMNSYCHRR